MRDSRSFRHSVTGATVGLMMIPRTFNAAFDSCPGVDCL